jgi:hypothetical protein
MQKCVSIRMQLSVFVAIWFQCFHQSPAAAGLGVIFRVVMSLIYAMPILPAVCIGVPAQATVLQPSKRVRLRAKTTVAQPPPKRQRLRCETLGSSVLVGYPQLPLPLIRVAPPLPAAVSSPYAALYAGFWPAGIVARWSTTDYRQKYFMVYKRIMVWLNEHRSPTPPTPLTMEQSAEVVEAYGNWKRMKRK